MDIESTDNTRIGMLIGKACRITSLPDLKTTIQLLYSNQVGNENNHDDLPPFHLSNDSIGTVKNQTRTRVVTFTCSKIHTRLLTSILQKLFTATTNYQFLSFPVMSSLSEATQAAILRQHQSECGVDAVLLLEYVSMRSGISHWCSWSPVLPKRQEILGSNPDFFRDFST